MLQKVIVVLVGLVMSVVGALSPDGLIGAQRSGDATDVAANTAEEALATLRTTDGQAFARVSVLWVEVDGRRVTEDAWGTGEVDEIRFKVGVKSVEDVAIAVGDKVVELHPTDIITVRMFRGDFSYRGLGTPLASVQLQGTVKTTVLNEGDVGNRVLTRTGDLDLAGVAPRGTSPGDESQVAYVVLTTGQKVDTVAIQDGGARLFTEEAVTASAATNEPGNLLAKWVKVDGKIVREYTWGDGPIRKIEFEPAEGVSRSVVLTFNDEVSEVAAGERVVIEDFVGEYLIYQVSGGMTRLKLDGYAAEYGMAAALRTPQVGGEGAPLAAFNWTPVSPKTTDTVQFTDVSSDDGMLAFHRWDFDDEGPIGVVENPSHRFTKPGTYDITLNVTDSDLQSSTVTHTIVVRNAEPVPDFDFSPKVVTTDTLVTFSDQSFDSDGALTSHRWDFGDGGTDTNRSPSHRFGRGGNATVTLTVTDELGGRASLSKVVLVRNAPPQAGFTFNTTEGGSPLTLSPIQFIDNSSDRDGAIVSWNWSFGDGSFGSGSAPVHAYARPGLFTVSLTVTDDGGDVGTASANILVGNRPPFVDFAWSPDGQPANKPVTFTSSASDPDGTVLTTVWDFGGAVTDRQVRGGVVTHTFPHAGTYSVTMTATDNTLGSSTVTHSVTVGNSAPRANFQMGPTPAWRNSTVTVSDTSSDPDGDALVNWTWDMGDGATRYGKVVHHVYQSIGTFTVVLEVRDSNGETATVGRSLRVLNRPPTVGMDIAPRIPVVAEDVTFTGYAVDPDVGGSAVTLEWRFNDGTLTTGDVITRNFSRAGNYSVTLTGRDPDGGVSTPVVRTIEVLPARPSVDFAFSPIVPNVNQQVNFTDLSFSPNGAIRQWKWTFGVQGASTSGRTNPTFTYPGNGSFDVTLEVTDVANMTNATTKTIYVNLPPIARFTRTQAPAVQLNQPLDFDDESEDLDGEVRNWSWEFGDGTTSWDRYPTHSYAAPGSYPVNLTVADDRNATGRMTMRVEVASSPPVAGFTHAALGGIDERGALILFNGSANSYDPDGTPLASYEWNFGDGTAPVRVADPSHVFLRSGFVNVGLVVGDPGGKISSVSPLSHQRLRIGANHSVDIHLSATIGGNRIADITSPDYVVSATIGGFVLGAESFTPNGTGVDIRIPKQLWIHNQTVRVSISASFLGSAHAGTVQLEDGVFEKALSLQLKMKIHPQIKPELRENPGLMPPELLGIPLVGTSSLFEASPVYHDIFEKPHGNGTIVYSDGTPASFARVDIEAKYVPLRVLQPVRSAGDNSDTTRSALGFCLVGTAEAYANGTYDWRFDGQEPCYTNGIVGGFYPVGRWEVRAVASAGGADPAVSPIAVFFVDPTGGTLLSAIAGLA